MVISIAICEKNRRQIEALRGIITEMSVEYDCDVQLYWLYGDNMREKLMELSDIINLALISLDMEDGAFLGKDLYKVNPHCYIMYYKQQESNLEPLLGSRPIAFHRGMPDNSSFREKLLQLWKDIWSQGNMFYYHSRELVCLLPYYSIAYFESDYKHVLIHTTGGRTLRFYHKLDEVERKLVSGFFLRVHKSYLVNINLAESIDKANRNLYLKTGDTVYISKMYYDHTIKMFEKLNTGDAI